MHSAPVVYKDIWFKIIGSLVSSGLIDALNRDESLFQRFGSVQFYIDLLGGFVIALLLWEMVRFATRYLDKKYSWTDNMVRRTLLQFVLGICVPALFSFIFTFLFMKLAYQQDIFQTSWLYNEFYTVILIIVLINIIYFSWWLYLTRKQQHIELSTYPKQRSIEGLSAGRTGSIPKTTIEVTKAGKTILLPFTEMAYSYLNDGYCYIKPFQGDGFVTTYTLDEVARLVNETDFFRVNRQIVVSRQSCIAYKSIDNGKIELDLNPPFKTPVIVSQKRARDFRKWVSPAVQV